MNDTVIRLEKLAKKLENVIKKNNLQRLGYSHTSCQSCKSTIKNILEFIGKFRDEKSKNNSA